MAIPASSTTLAQGTLPVVDSSASTFNFHTHAVRVIMRDGEPWFICTDVAEALGYRDAHNAARCLADHQRDTHNLSTPSGEQSVTIISESGLYRLVLRSRKPEAVAFSDWVTGEVLPSIRKTGGYYGKEQKPEPSTDPERIKLARSLAAKAAETVSREVSRAVFNEVMVTGNSRHGSWKLNRWLLSFDYDEAAKDLVKPTVRAEVEHTPEELIEAWFEPNSYPFSMEFMYRLARACMANIFASQQCMSSEKTGKGPTMFWHIGLEKGAVASAAA